VIVLGQENIDKLISQGQESIEYILQRIKVLGGATKQDYDMLAHLDDALIELKDTHNSYTKINNAFNKLRRELKK
jgi:ribosome-associated translation inhibitor RaiA